MSEVLFFHLERRGLEDTLPVLLERTRERDKKKALQFLNTAIEKGFSDAGMITANKAFDSLRDDPEYQQIIARLRKQ